MDANNNSFSINTKGQITVSYERKLHIPRTHSHLLVAYNKSHTPPPKKKNKKKKNKKEVEEEEEEEEEAYL